MGVHDSFYAIARMLAVLSLCPKARFFVSRGISEKLKELYDVKKNEKALEIAKRGIEAPWGFFALIAHLAEENPEKYPHLARGDITKTTAVINDLLQLKRKNLEAARELLSILDENSPTEELILKSPLRSKEQLLEKYDRFVESWEVARRLMRCAVKLYESEKE